LFIVTSSRGMNNAIVIIDSKYIYLIDTLYNEEDNLELKKILDKYNKPIILLHSHYHFDHIAGQRIIEPKEIVANEKYKILLNKQLNYNNDRFLGNAKYDMEGKYLEPTITFSKNISFNTDTFGELRFVHYGGHSDDSSMLFIDSMKVILCGDNILASRHKKYMPPFFSWGFYSEMFAMNKELIEKYSDYYLISGHSIINNGYQKLLEDKFYLKNIVKLSRSKDFSKLLPKGYSGFLVDRINDFNLKKVKCEKSIDIFI